MSSLVRSVVNWNSNAKASVNPNDLCEICGKKPKYIEKGFKHPYCGRTCARKGQDLFPGTGECLLLGCRAAGRTVSANFCSDAHGREAVRLGQVASCDRCGVQPRSAGNLCTACDRRAKAGPHKLRQLKPDGSSFKSLRAQFRSEWEDLPTLPNIEKVYEVYLSAAIRKNYEDYLNNHRNKTPIRTFHAAQCICDLGTKGSTLCDLKSCGICSIVKSSFGEFAFGEQYNVGRFGKGIYAYRDPSLADQFATSCTSSPYRVMIACDTLVEQDQLDDANDRESIFIDSADAIIPVYIIMYCK